MVILKIVARTAELGPHIIEVVFDPQLEGVLISAVLAPNQVGIL